MTRRLAPHRAAHAALFAVLFAVPSSILAQSGVAVPATETEIQLRLNGIESEIAELEDVKRLIENDKHVVLLSGAAGALVTREQAESFLVTQMFEGKVSGAQVAEYAQMIGMGTRIFLQEHVIRGIAELERERTRLLALQKLPASSRPPFPNPALGAGSTDPGGVDWPAPMDWLKVRGTTTGRYSIWCSSGEDSRIELKGGFRITLEGNGTVTGTYEDDAVQWPAPGRIDASGVGTGEGANAYGSYRYRVQFVRNGLALSLGGNTWFTPTASDYRCTAGSLFPAS